MYWRGENEFKKNPQGKKRLEDRERVREELENFVESVKSNPRIFTARYGWIDSALDTGTANELDNEPMFNTFSCVLPEGTKSLRGYVEKVLAPYKGTATFVEYGGPASRIAAEFTPGFFERSFGVTAVDLRNDPAEPELYAGHLERDAALRHEVVEGNLLTPKIYKELRNKNRGKKFTFIIERMAKGLEFAPLDTKTAGALLQTWYESLDDGGLMLVQVPTHFNIFLSDWVALVEEHCGTTLEIRYNDRGQTEAGDQGYTSALLIRKLPGAPESLPMLDAKTVKEIIRKRRK